MFFSEHFHGLHGQFGDSLTSFLVQGVESVGLS